MFVIIAAENSASKQNVSCEQMSARFSKNTKPVLTISEDKPKCSFCSNDHKLYQCKQFKEANYEKRWEIVKKNRLCFCCLSTGHGVHNCSRRRECGLASCKKYHNKLLHNTNVNSTKNGNPVLGEAAVNTVSAFQTVSATSVNVIEENVKIESRERNDTNNLLRRKTLLKFMPVKLQGPNGSLTVMAFIDDGAKVTLLEEKIASQLGLKGAASLLHLKWIDNQTTSEMAKNVSVEISGTQNGAKSFSMKGVRTTKKLNLPPQTLNLEQFRQQYKELCNIDLYDYIDAVPQILIGVPHTNLVRALNILNFDDGFTVHETKLGYTLFGSNENCIDCATVCHVDIDSDFMIDLQKQVADYFALEGFEPKQLPCIQSECDARAQRILIGTTKLIGQRYETGLLWKNDCVRFPESYSMALKRLELVEKKMMHNEGFASWYKGKIAEYAKKGYARKLTNAEAEISDERTWYLPHFVTYNLNKGNKPRLVFDAAAKINEASFNSALMKGPDVYHPKALTSILFKFREGKIGICGDIKEMFHRINICSKDQNAQRFLWREGNQSIPPDVYAMNAMIFGSVCSPCSAQFVKNLNASRFANDYPRAVDAIVNRHYVDDYVDSFDEVEESIRVTKKVIDIHESAGFELRGFVSNSVELLKAITKNSASVEQMSKNMSVNEFKYDKVLGMYWDAKNDVFYFNLTFARIPKPVLEGHRRPTKAELLGVTMSIFDPFGFLAHITLIPKILLQRLWHVNIGWHDFIPDEIYERWYQWYTALDTLKEFSVPRCYYLKCKDLLTDIQLHVFVDASELAFAAVAYWRICYQDEVSVAFVAGKSRCSPLKPLSIPRLELQSAVLGTRLKNIIISSHEVKPNKVVFWSDAKTVIQWIRSEARRYKQFVCNRISEILQSSEVAQWRWVPGSLNPADDATRPQEKLNFSSSSRWINGPIFLRNPEEDWPKLPQDIFENVSKEEQRTKQLYSLQNDEEVIPFTKFSNYYKFLKIMTWVRFAIMKFRSIVVNKNNALNLTLSAQDIKKTEIMLVRLVQHAIYREEANALQNGLHLSKQSSLFNLTPIMDEDGVMRLGGRIDYAECLPMYTRRPIIMPKCHAMTRLIARHYHEMMYHQNQEAIVCAIRIKYWIPSIRRVLQSVKNECQLCKNLLASPKVPLMGQIPADRLTPYVRPFSFTGLDYFGPIMVSIGRRREKRWVALFTCLSVRAIHLELARDLSADAVILCLRNFVNRRGLPVRIRSDRGTNFIGASKEEWLQIEESIDRECTRRGIEWVFNTPANPSAGGIWERMVRSVKRVLTFTLKETAPQIETMISLLIEAENLVNSRPLTHLPIDSIDADPLTPNHFLLGCSNFIQTSTVSENVCLKKQWRILQQLKQTFWRRWTLEYLPTLTRRTKWHQRVKPIQIGDIVIICDDNESRGEWKRGVVLEVFPALDGQVRSALVKTNKGNLRRPASKLAVLDVSSEPQIVGAPSVHGGWNVVDRVATI